MKAPRLKSMFRNVKNKPRAFSFKTRHTEGMRGDWDERKNRVESEVGREKGEGSIAAPRINFKRKRHANRVSAKKAARIAMIKTLLIGAVLLYVTYEIIIWAETTEWGEMLEFIKNNG
jgi:hypothetical protein|tara:strand:- start:150 stop:503 length:354 start_codon:yes stop_codon:yes gene_type:complete